MGIKTLVPCIRFYFHPKRKELPLAFQHETSHLESLKEFLPFLNDPANFFSVCLMADVSLAMEVKARPISDLLLTRRCLPRASTPTPLPPHPQTSSVLPKITRLLNEFPSAAVWHAGTPPFNWSGPQPGATLEGCKVVRPSSTGQEGNRVFECVFGSRGSLLRVLEKRRRN